MAAEKTSQELDKAAFHRAANSNAEAVARQSHGGRTAQIIGAAADLECSSLLIKQLLHDFGCQLSEVEAALARCLGQRLQ